MAKGRKRGRPQKDGPRDKSGRLIPPGKFTTPPDHILARRNLFSFVTPTKGQDGRSGEIDQDVCDGIGQFHALGLLDDEYGLDLRNIGRLWRDLWLKQHGSSATHPAGLQRVDCEVDYTHTVIGADALTMGEAALFDRLDSAVKGFERSMLIDLLISPMLGCWPMGEENAPWVRGMIGKGLLDRKRLPPGSFIAVSLSDVDRFKACVRGLFALQGASTARKMAA